MFLFLLLLLPEETVAKPPNTSSPPEYPPPLFPPVVSSLTNEQIAREAKRFARASGLSVSAVYGGSGVANQITELKRGVEIVVCTPGRMIDVLATSGGKITNLRRVTYLVLDEADRMFDMGFEPQISRIMQNIRPDRQNVMFSATFPRSVRRRFIKKIQKNFKKMKENKN